MNKYVKEFLHRGLIFGGFGPIIMGIIYAILQASIDGFSLNGYEVLTAIISIYVLAFLQAGASVFNQIENWSIAKSLCFHFLTLYISYVGCYLLNRWIPFNINVILVFTAVFVLIYFIIWIAVYISVKSISKKLNQSFKS